MFVDKKYLEVELCILKCLTMEISLINKTKKGFPHTSFNFNYLNRFMYLII